MMLKKICVILLSLNSVVACALGAKIDDYNYESFFVSTRNVEDKDLMKIGLYSTKTGGRDGDLRRCIMHEDPNCVLYRIEEDERLRADYIGMKADLQECQSTLKRNGLEKVLTK